VWLVGNRDDDEWAALGISPPESLAPGLHVIDGRQLVEADVSAVEERLATHILGRCRPVWLHVDLDVLDGELMPAVSYPQVGGPSWSTLESLAIAVARTGNLIGVDVTDLDPDRDPDGSHTRATAEFLERVIAAAT
jgi:arginase